MSELFCIKRDDAEVPEYMKKLRNDKETCDVTLVGSDGEIVQAHRNVLLLNSDYIREMLRRNTSLTPALWIPDISSKDLCRILDFIYYGKILLNVEDMENFIRQSKILKVKGMVNDTYTVDLQNTENDDNHSVKTAEISLEENVKPIKEETQEDTNVRVHRQNNLDNVHLSLNSYLETDGSNVAMWLQMSRQERDEYLTQFPVDRSSSGKPPPMIYLNGKEISRENLQMELMKLQTQLRKDQYKCNRCQHTAYAASHIREHVERHIKTLVYKCRLCSKMSKNSNEHRSHFNKGRCVKK